VHICIKIAFLAIPVFRDETPPGLLAAHGSRNDPAHIAGILRHGRAIFLFFSAALLIFPTRLDPFHGLLVRDKFLVLYAGPRSDSVPHALPDRGLRPHAKRT